MVISLLPAGGAKCQVGDFSVVVDSSTEKKPTAKSSRKNEKRSILETGSVAQKKGKLTLKTTSFIPIDSFHSTDVIDGPGEYEISGTRITGVAFGDANKEKIRTAYSVEFDDIRLAFLFNLESEPSREVLDKLGETNILFLSADTKKLNPKQLISLIKQTDPNIVIPIGDKMAKTLGEAMGQKIKSEEKLVIRKSDITKQETTHKIVWLKTK